MKVGIIGLPQAGATTVFNALTGAHGDTSAGHRAGETRAGVIHVPDTRLEFISRMFEPKKTTLATIEVEDCAGALGHIGTPGQAGSAGAIAELRAQTALLAVLRAFDNPAVPHALGSIDPMRDLARIEEELLLADLGIVENRTETVRGALERPMPGKEKAPLQEEMDLLEQCHGAIEQQRGIRSLGMNAAQEKILRSYSFLTLKPLIVVLNVGEADIGKSAQDIAHVAQPGEWEALVMCARLEMEIMELDEQDRGEFMADAGLAAPAAGSIVRECFRALGLRTFFTYGPVECRAWTVRAGETALDAAAEVHTDLAQGFIRAEVVAFNDLEKHGSMREVKAAGRFRLEGKDYEVQDGDIIIIRHSA